MDGESATLELLHALRPHMTAITRLRRDARLFDPPCGRDRRGRPARLGARQPLLAGRAPPTRLQTHVGGPDALEPAGMMARLPRQALSDIWGQPVVVENKPGGNALIGAEAAAKSPPDGHTLLAIAMTHAVNATLFPNAPYDFRQDFAGVSVLAAVPQVVYVNAAKSPACTLQDLAALAEDSGSAAVPPATDPRPIWRWRCSVVPLAPAAFRAKIAQDTQTAMGDTDLRHRAEEAGFEVLAWDAARSGRFIAEETARWASLIAAAGIRAD